MVIEGQGGIGFEINVGTSRGQFASPKSNHLLELLRYQHFANMGVLVAWDMRDCYFYPFS